MRPIYAQTVKEKETRSARTVAEEWKISRSATPVAVAAGSTVKPVRVLAKPKCQRLVNENDKETKKE